MIHPLTETHEACLAFEFTGKLESDDYHGLVSRCEEAIEKFGKIRVLVWFHDFEGWTPSGFWRDMKFSLKHYGSIEKFAVVGEEKWQRTLIELAKPLSGAEVRYFSADQLEAARDWVETPNETSQNEAAGR